LRTLLELVEPEAGTTSASVALAVPGFRLLHIVVSFRCHRKWWQHPARGAARAVVAHIPRRLRASFERVKT